MFPKIGFMPAYALWYFAGIVAQFYICLFGAWRLGVRRRAWVAIAVAYGFGMTVGAKALHDLRSGNFALAALLRPDHDMAGGLWGGPLVFLVLAVPAAWWLAKDRAVALDLVALSPPVPMALAKVGCVFQGCCYGKPRREWMGIEPTRDYGCSLSLVLKTRGPTRRPVTPCFAMHSWRGRPAAAQWCSRRRSGHVPCSYRRECYGRRTRAAMQALLVMSG